MYNIEKDKIRKRHDNNSEELNHRRTVELWGLMRVIAIEGFFIASLSRIIGLRFGIVETSGGSTGRVTSWVDHTL